MAAYFAMFSRPPIDGHTLCPHRGNRVLRLRGHCVLWHLLSGMAVTLSFLLCAATSRGRLPAAGADSGMAQVLTWLYADGSSSIAGQDAAAAPQAMSVSSLRVRPRSTLRRRLCQGLLGICGELCALCHLLLTIPVNRCLVTFCVQQSQIEAEFLYYLWLPYLQVQLHATCT